jgi:hypothetical protein
MPLSIHAVLTVSFRMTVFSSDASLVPVLKLIVRGEPTEVSMAAATAPVVVGGYAIVCVKLKGKDYPGTRLGVLQNLCCDIILGLDFQRQHSEVTFSFGGPKPCLVVRDDPVCALTAAKVEEPTLFANLLPDVKPIATKSRRYNYKDREFIKSEVETMLAEEIIEPSKSPWRAQIVVVKDEFDRHRKRLCVDYSNTINIYTQLDAYPLPRIDVMINVLSKYLVFSTLDLKSAYHQIQIPETDRPYTAFEANGKLYQYRRVPFGVTNGVPSFQLIIDRIVEEDSLHDTFGYLDNITIAGRTQAEHDSNLQKFMASALKRQLTFNESKSVISKASINLLGYEVGNGIIKPDKERLKPLQDLPPPANIKALRRVLGMFAYYAKWIPDSSNKIQPLVTVKEFPLGEPALKTFASLKKELEIVSLASIDETKPFVVETDASYSALAATLNQGGRPVAFMSRTLHGPELNHPSVEKEAAAIVAAVEKWSHF